MIILGLFVGMEGQMETGRSLMQRPIFWAGATFVWLLGLAWLAGYDGLYGQDAYAHYNYARSIQDHWHAGTPLGHYQWPRLFAFLGALWMWGDPVVWMQLLAMAGAALGVGMLVRLLQARHPGDRWVGPLAFACVGLSGVVVRNSVSVMADGPAFGLMVTALWLGWRYRQAGELRHLLLAGLAAGGAIMLRYPAVLLLAPYLLAWSLQALRRKQWLGLAMLGPCLAFAALPHFLLPQAAGEGLSQPFQHQHFWQWSPLNYFSATFQQVDGKMSYPYPNFVDALGLFWHPRYLGLGGLGLLGWIWRKRLGLGSADLLAVTALGINAVFLAGIPFQNPRFYLLSIPFAVLLVAPVWAKVLEHAITSPWIRRGLVGGMLLVHLALCLASCRLIWQVNAEERAIAAHLKSLPQHGQRLYELSFQAMLQAREVDLPAVSLWEGPVPPPRPGDLVLFNLQKFETQFAGMWPMKNWEALHLGHEFTILQEWPHGWKLYEIQ